MTQLFAILLTLLILPFSTAYLLFSFITTLLAMPTYIFEAIMAIITGESEEDFIKRMNLGKDKENNK